MKTNCLPTHSFTSFLIALLLQTLTGAVSAEEPQRVAYAVFNSESHTLTFSYDTHKSENTYDMSVARKGDDYERRPEWTSIASNVKTVVFEPSYADYRPHDCTAWFAGMTQLENIQGIKYLNTSKVLSMAMMFTACGSLKTIDFSHFDTRNVTDMCRMFENCSSIDSLDLSRFNTARVKDMSNMFMGCSSLTKLDLTHFDTSQVTNMSWMFADCENLASLDLTHFHTGNVIDLSFMFTNCKRIKTLDLSHFNTAKVKYMQNMFWKCRFLSSINVSNFNTAEVTNMTRMFANCPRLRVLDLSSFNTAQVEFMNEMFYKCISLTTIFASSKFTVDNVNGGYAFIYDRGWVQGGLNFERKDYEIQGFVLNGLFRYCNELKGAIKCDETSHKYGKEYANSRAGYFTSRPYRVPNPKLLAVNSPMANEPFVPDSTHLLKTVLRTFYHGSNYISVEYPMDANKPFILDKMRNWISHYLGGKYLGDPDDYKGLMNAFGSNLPPGEGNNSIRIAYEDDNIVTYQCVRYEKDRNTDETYGVTYRKRDGKCFNARMFANTPEFGNILLARLRDIFEVETNNELVELLRDKTKKSIPLPRSEAWVTSKGVTLQFTPGLFDTVDPGYRATVVIPLDQAGPLLNAEGKNYMNPTLAKQITNNK